MIAYFVQAEDVDFNFLYAVRSSKIKFKISEISKRPQDKSRFYVL